MSSKLTVQAFTDVGLKREHNEDYYGFVDDLGIYVVCDGMGGHASGEVASRMTVEHVVEFVNDHQNTPPETMPYGHMSGATQAETLLSNAIQYANDRVYVEGMKDPKLEGMGTTIVAVLAEADRLVVGHVGDSRVYCFNKEARLSQVTRDHSLLNYKIDRGELKTAEEIANFEQGNIIVRAIGLKDYVSPEVQTVVRRPNDIFLLCSDGLTDLVDDWLIENVMDANSETLDEGNEALVRMANDRGGKDNITVMMLRVDDEAAVDGVDASEESEEEVTDPRGIEVVEELTDGHKMSIMQQYNFPVVDLTNRAVLQVSFVTREPFTCSDAAALFSFQPAVQLSTCGSIGILRGRSMESAAQHPELNCLSCIAEKRVGGAQPAE